MNPVNNPFNHGGGSRPATFYGRDELIEQITVVLERLKLNRHSTGIVMTGLRGVGKTLLLLKAAEIAGDLGNIEVLDIEIPESSTSRKKSGRQGDFVGRLLRQVNQLTSRIAPASEAWRKVKSAIGNLASRFQVTIRDVQISFPVADSGELEQDLSELLYLTAELVQKEGTHLLLVIDEMQYLDRDELSGLCYAVHRISQKELPMRMIGAGLPHITGLAGDAKSYAERLFSYPDVGPLSTEATYKSLCDPFFEAGQRVDEASMLELATSIDGYPYFTQVLGYFLWECAEEGEIIGNEVCAQAEKKAREFLYQNLYSVRFERLTELQKKYLRAMAELPGAPYRTAAIAKKLGVTTPQVSPIREQLISLGMIYSQVHGQADFTVPQFGPFVKSRMPELLQHKPKSRKRVKRKSSS